jgi:hypothetical protein
VNQNDRVGELVDDPFAEGVEEGADDHEEYLGGVGDEPMLPHLFAWRLLHDRLHSLCLSPLSCLSLSVGVIWLWLQGYATHLYRTNGLVQFINAFSEKSEKNILNYLSLTFLEIFYGT